MAEVGLPFRNTLWYYRLASYASCPEFGDTAVAVSCEWRVARPGAGSDKHVANFSADSPLAVTLWEQVDDYVFHLEYVPQCDDSLISDVLNRSAYGFLTPLAFILGVNTSIASDGDKSYYEMSGCKPKTVTISASTNNKYIVAIDFSVRSIVTDGDASFITPVSAISTYAPSALSGEYLGFNVAGSIRNGAGESLAEILDSMTVTFDHHLTDEYDHDSKEKVKCIEGKYTCTGSFTISMDEGGGMTWFDVFAQTEFDVDISLGSSGCPMLQLPKCKWRTHEFTVDTSDGALKEDVPFTSQLSDGGQSVVSDAP